MVAAIVLLYVLGSGGLAAAVAGNGIAPTAGLGLGIGLTAYLLGMRHAFDADHIAAIDNVTRRLTGSSPRRPISVGFWFSLGHSTVVVALAVALAVGLRQALGPFTASGSAGHEILATFGATVSGVFLLTVGAVNAIALRRLLRPPRSDAQTTSPGPGGPLARVLARPLGAVARPGHMYPVGFLFGLGFDTATEIGILVVAASSAAAGFPWYGVLSLPVLFAAGMVTFDTLDGAFMGMAYSWALSDAVRKRRYSIVVTAISVAVAGAIGVFQLISAIPPGLRWTEWLQAELDPVDLTLVGIAIAALFAITFITGRLAARASGARRSTGSEGRPLTPVRQSTD